jgi:hypothetical protein
MHAPERRARLTVSYPDVVTPKKGRLLGNVGCLSLVFETKHA